MLWFIISTLIVLSYFCSKGKEFVMIYLRLILFLVKCINYMRELVRDRSKVYSYIIELIYIVLLVGFVN